MNRKFIVMMLAVVALADCGHHVKRAAVEADETTGHRICDRRFEGNWAGIDSLQKRETLVVNTSACTAIYNGVPGYIVATNGNLITVVRDMNGTTDSDEFRLANATLRRYRPNIAALQPPYRITLIHERT